MAAMTRREPDWRDFVYSPPRSGGEERPPTYLHDYASEDELEAWLPYCAERGWPLVETLTDDGVSGGRRERFERLDARLRATGAKVVVAYHLDRVARGRRCAPRLARALGPARHRAARRWPRSHRGADGQRLPHRRR